MIESKSLLATMKQLVDALETYGDKHRKTYLLEGAWDEEITKGDAAIQAGKKVIAELESQEPRNVRERWNVEFDGNDLLVCFNDHEKGNKCQYERYSPQRTEERNFCPRCGKRLGGIDSIHTCTPPMEQNT